MTHFVTGSFRLNPSKRQGNGSQAIAGATRKIEATYYSPFCAHVTLEPQNRLARHHPAVRSSTIRWSSGACSS